MYFDVPAAGDRNMVGDFLVGLRNFVLDEFKGDLLTDSPISINDNEGRLLEMSIPNQGVAIAIILVANSRLYRIAVVAQKAAKTDANTKSITTSFFDSFRLLPIDRSKEGEVDSYIRSNPELAKQAIATEGFNTDLNLKALSMPRPRYPPLAHGVHASGTVIVKVIIDEQGNVMAAQATSGHPLLQPDAVDAARKARFPPRIEAGKPVKALGRLTYNFVSL